MGEPRIYVLLEEIAKEIRVAEKKNLELYTSAIDEEDERLSVKMQAESFAALRRMKGLKSAMDVFKSELEKSGILKSESEEGVYISIEHGSIGIGDSAKPEPKPPFKPEPEPEPTIQFAPQPEPQPEPTIQFASQPEPQPEPTIKFAPEPQPEPTVQFAPNPAPKPRPEPEPAPAFKYEPEPELQMKTDYKFKFATPPESDGAFIAETGYKFESEQEAEPKSKFKYDPEPEAETKPKFKYDPEPAPALKFEPEGRENGDFEDFGGIDETGTQIPDHIAQEIEAMGDIIDSLKYDEGDNDDGFDDIIQFPAQTPQVPQTRQSAQNAPAPAPQQPREYGGDNERVISTVEEALGAIEQDTSARIDEEINAAIQGISAPASDFSSEEEFSPFGEDEPSDEAKPTPSAPRQQQLQQEPEPDFSGFVMPTPDSTPDVGIYNNRIPAAFIVFGRRVDVRDWGDMLVKVCEILILKNPYTVAQFDKYHDLNPLGNRYFSYNRAEIKGVARKLSNGLWIELNRTHDDVVMLCKKLLELCGYPRSEIEIEFAN